MNVGVLPPRWIWPAVILCSAVISGLFFFLELASPFRLIATLWFLLVCPGMAFVRLLQLDESYYEWTLGIALSISLDAIVACILLYGGLWSIELAISIVVLLSLLGASLQIFVLRPPSAVNHTGQTINSKGKRVDSWRCPNCQAEKRQWRAGLSRSGRQRYQCSQCKKIYTPIVKAPTSETSQHAIPQTFKIDGQQQVN